MAPKRTQIVHVNKGNDKIVSVQSTHDTAMGPMTHSKTKSTSSLSTKQTSEPACLLKPVRMRDEHQPLITLIFLGAKSHSPHNRVNFPSTLKDFGDKSPCSVIDANYSTNSHSRSPTRMSNEESYFNCFDSFTSPFLMNMLVMTIDTTSVEERLAKMACAIAKLTKMVEEKDMQIVFLINKVEAQVQNTGESSQELNYLSNVASSLNDVPHASRIVQVERQTMEFASIASLFVQQLQDMIANTIRAQYGGPSQSTLMYSKPYTKRIDNLRTHVGYQPLKFQSFDGKGNSKQHVAHFIETCNNAGIDGDLLVK